MSSSKGGEEGDLRCDSISSQVAGDQEVSRLYSLGSAPREPQPMIGYSKSEPVSGSEISMAPTSSGHGGSNYCENGKPLGFCEWLGEALLAERQELERRHSLILEECTRQMSGLEPPIAPNAPGAKAAQRPYQRSTVPSIHMAPSVVTKADPPPANHSYGVGLLCVGEQDVSESPEGSEQPSWPGVVPNDATGKPTRTSHLQSNTRKQRGSKASQISSTSQLPVASSPSLTSIPILGSASFQSQGYTSQSAAGSQGRKAGTEDCNFGEDSSGALDYVNQILNAEPASSRSFIPDVLKNSWTDKFTGGSTSTVFSTNKSLVRQASVGLFSFGAKHSEGSLRGFVTSSKFEFTLAVFIVLNTIVMALQSQYDGLGLCTELKYGDCTRTKQASWPGADTVFTALDWVFGVIFTCELLLKLLGLKLRFVCDFWNVFDFFIVSLWLLDALSRDLVEMPVDTMLLRLARLARLLRLLKLAKTIRGLDPLFLMVTTLQGSVAVLMWASLFLLVCLTLCAFLVQQIVMSNYLELTHIDTEKRKEVFRYFGTFSRSMLSMFEITLGNWVPIGRCLFENVSEFFILFSVAHKLSMGFAVIGVINGIFIQETFKVAACDDTVMLLQKERAIRMHVGKMKRLFSKADLSGDGLIGRDEWRSALADHQIRNWLAAQELESCDVDLIFSLLTKDKDEMSVLDLVTGVTRLKGNARSIDLVKLMHHVEEIEDHMHRMHDTVHTVCEAVNGPTISGQHPRVSVSQYDEEDGDDSPQRAPSKNESVGSSNEIQ